MVSLNVPKCQEFTDCLYSITATRLVESVGSDSMLL